MDESLGQLLDPHHTITDPTALSYLTHLTTLPSSALHTSEPQSLSQSSHSLLLSLQSLSKRSHKPIIDSATRHASLRTSLPALFRSASDLRDAVPRLDAQTETFATTFTPITTNNNNINPILLKRKNALKLLSSSERLVGAMELPQLLRSAVGIGSASAAVSPANYSSTLDLYTHVHRLASLYPDSPLIASIMTEADAAVREMAADLLTALKAPSLKLAAALRAVGWLKRLMPDLVTTSGQVVAPDEVLPALFLVCRVSTLIGLLGALDPLRELADEERERQGGKSAQSQFGGQQTERYLKRYIEIFREHSFNIASVFKSVNATFVTDDNKTPENNDNNDPLRPLPSALSTLPLYLVEMLLETLRIYLPTVKDQTSRESILTQVLYCAGSLGRLGADFGMLLATIGVSEWVDLVKRHRLLAGRLESVIGDYNRSQPVSNI